ncbi:Smc5-Smc6 complex subunit [Pichia kluyveri]|uniref:Non-structural maintenance of chromosomes element 4 n=1 Tax=Pichia kluyveri TaxID=36015 RepID=A0AAV5QZ31_PICKL|nr:Smc5-Smc6 complex subunit [Pichia kluyveri]
MVKAEKRTLQEEDRVSKRRHLEEEDKEVSEEISEEGEKEEEGSEEEEEEEGSEEDEDEDEEDDKFGKKQLNEDEQFKLSDKYRKLKDKLENQRSKLTTDEGIGIVTEQLTIAENLFKDTKTSSNTVIIATDSATLREIGEQAKIATKNVKFGKSDKTINFQLFTNSFLKCFTNITNDEEKIFNEFDKIPEYNWSNAGLLFNSISKNVQGSDFLLGPLVITKKKKIIRQRLVDDSKKNNVIKTADLKSANEVINKDVKDDTSKSAEKLFKRLKEYGKPISIFEVILNPISFGKSIETLFITSFLINNGMLVLDKFENNIPFLQLANNESIKNHLRFQNNDDSKSHIVFNLDQETWSKLIKEYKIEQPFFTI